MRRSHQPVGLFLVALSTALIQAQAQAQTPPDAGALRQQIERDRATPLPGKTAPEKLTAPPEPMRPTAGIVITVRQFRLAGNTLLSSDQLMPVLSGYLNRPLDFAQLEAAAADVANIYRSAGWLARVYLPKQDVTEGVITLQIVEAVYSGASLDGEHPQRLKLPQVLNIFNAQQATGQPVNTNALDRALLLADDLPGVAVAGNLVEGKKDGETGIKLKLSDEALAAGDASVDNVGSRSTGSERLSANLYLNSPLGLGDQFIGNLAHTEGSDYVRAAFTAPLGYDGWRVGANAATLRYKIVSPEFAALNGQGSSDSLGLEASYPVIRSRSRNLYFSLNYDHKNFHNESSATVQSDYISRNLSVGLSGNTFDELGGGGVNSASLALVAGSIALGQLDTGENLEREGNFGKLRYSLSRQQAIGRELSLYAVLSGQQADKTLDSSEKLSLGGSSGVRAYPSGEGSGSSGQLATLELRQRLPQGFSAVVFYDWGSVSNSDGSPSYSLQGAGLGVNWQTPIGATVKATWAQRLGDNPNPSATGTDQDGTLNRSRWWLTASIPF
ncbi:MAG: ShlB/FhaC/HecB family hemolysin secretion/activation protein [Rhodoferax sp.]|nr:ShlB/FhaC/HecB family hemolysin secretion/activation protein [Rhodoferax sp.]